MLTKLWPVRVGRAHVAWDVAQPAAADLLVVVQIQLAVHHGPGVGLDRRLVARSDAEGTVAAVLRRIFRRRGDELVAVRGTGEAVSRAFVRCGEFGPARDRSFLGEVGDRVMALDRGVVLRLRLRREGEN